jgi:hypothetical protein
MGMGEYIAWYEYEGDTAVRQVEYDNGRWLSSRDDYHAGHGIGLADVPFSSLALEAFESVSADEFETAWQEADRSRSENIS